METANELFAQRDEVALYAEHAQQMLQVPETKGMAMNESLSHLLASNERQAVERFVDTLLQQYPERVLKTALFGSKARGDSTPYSDIDILLIVDKDDWQFSHIISTIAARVSLEYDVLIGPRVIGRERCESMKRRRFSLYQTSPPKASPSRPSQCDPTPSAPVG